MAVAEKSNEKTGSGHEISVRRAADKFRRTREQAGLSVRQLADKAGLSPSTVLKLERHELTPSIAVCMRLAGALNRKISYFVEDEDPRDEVRYIPAGSGRCSGVGMPVVTTVLAEPLVNPRMESFLLVIEVGGDSGSEGHITYRGEEIVYCLKGRVSFSIRGEDYVVAPGDTLHFKGDIPHRWANVGRGRAELLMTCAFGDQGGE
ncbi:MAG: cupin domain-containing protein [Proteobacteria bacterium]|nr:cupin domain-containing protein [Pseudomonadota bacterium]